MTLGLELPEPKWETGKQAVFLVGLSWFRSEVKRINFHNGAVMRQARPLELTFAGGLQKNSSDYLIEFSLPARDFRGTSVDAIVWLDRLLAAMRLTKAGAVIPGLVIMYQPAVPNSRGFELWHWVGDSTYESGEYLLTRKDLHTLRRIYLGVSQLDEAKSFGPFARFTEGRRRIQPQDRLIDYWIALESLFSAEGESQELKYKYAIRIGHYIGDDAKNRYEIFGRMKEAYNVRSKVVHGKHARNLGQAEVDSEWALRWSLRRAALDARLPDLEELDRLAASGK